MRNTLGFSTTAAITFASVVSVLTLSTSAAAFSTYQSRVPNGSEFRCGTCHTNANLGGEGWNPFGEDVLRQDPDVQEADIEGTNQNINYNLPSPTWDANLCGADSDGDTQTNGQELGDPECSWVFGQPVPRAEDISNPGDPASTSANPDGVDGGGEGEGEGEGGGEGEGEGEPPPGCMSNSTSTSAPMGAFALALLFALRRRRRA
jgi:MYXO-CTERM domain-containing protein